MTHDGTWTERWWFALGSDAHCQVTGGPDDLASRAVDEIERLEQCWSRFRDDSELVALNSDTSTRVAVSPPLAAALHRALVAWRLTDGWFDPTILDALEAAGYDNSFRDDDIARGDLRRCRPGPGPEDVEVDLEAGLVIRPRGLRFDLGGIGKGLAADLVTTRLLAWGARSVCLGLGGDVRVAGDPPEGGWRIPVEHPHGTGHTTEPWFDAALTDGAIVASTTRFRRWTTTDGEPAHHLIDPGTGRPSRSGLETVVVAAAEAWWAESLAKAALLAGPTAGRRLLDRHGVTGWLVEAGGAPPVLEEALACSA